MPNYKPIIPPEMQSEKEKKLLAEWERIDTKLTYHKHRLKALEHEEAQLERKTRNHRIFTRGGMLESFLLKPTLLSDDQVHNLLEGVPELLPIQREFYLTMLTERKEKILDYSLELLMEQEQHTSPVHEM